MSSISSIEVQDTYTREQLEAYRHEALSGRLRHPL